MYVNEAYRLFQAFQSQFTFHLILFFPYFQVIFHQYHSITLCQNITIFVKLVFTIIIRSSMSDQESASNNSGEQGQKLTGRWQNHEHLRFIESLVRFGKDWKKIEESIPTRTGQQIRSHSQKYFAKLNKIIKDHKKHKHKAPSSPYKQQQEILDRYTENDIDDNTPYEIQKIIKQEYQNSEKIKKKSEELINSQPSVPSNKSQNLSNPLPKCLYSLEFQPQHIEQMISQKQELNSSFSQNLKRQLELIRNTSVSSGYLITLIKNHFPLFCNNQCDILSIISPLTPKNQDNKFRKQSFTVFAEETEEHYSKQWVRR